MESYKITSFHLRDNSERILKNRIAFLLKFSLRFKICLYRLMSYVTKQSHQPSRETQNAWSFLYTSLTLFVTYYLDVDVAVLTTCCSILYLGHPVVLYI
jgi:hypothetical protein